jgi:hypothetical protein
MNSCYFPALLENSNRFSSSKDKLIYDSIAVSLSEITERLKMSASQQRA